MSQRGTRKRVGGEGQRRTPLLMTVTSAALAASIAAGMGAGLAQAAPEQGGTSPSDTAPQQGGTTPGQTAPEQGGTTPTPEVAPVAVPGPGSLPAPPQEAPYQPYVEPSTYEAPTYDDAYDPVPEQPLTVPKPTAPVRPIAPPPEKIRVGNFITDIPKGMSERDVNSLNAWSAYGEAKIAQGLISVGVPADEASRQAASTIIGVMTGGTAGAVTLGIPAAVVGAAGGAVIGAGVGAVAGGIYNAVVFPYLIFPTGGGIIGLGAAAGAGIGLATGAAIGAVGVGAAGATVGAAIGGTAGGALAYALGAGDPGANPAEPWKQRDPKAPKARPLPNPGANQFELKLSPEDAQNAGLPAVDYVVNARGDVHASVAGMHVNWSVEQAMAPYGLLGAGARGAENSARQGTKQRSTQAQSAIPGLHVAWPQESAPAH